MQKAKWCSYCDTASFFSNPKFRSHHVCPHAVAKYTHWFGSRIGLILAARLSFGQCVSVHIQPSSRRYIFISRERVSVCGRRAFFISAISSFFRHRALGFICTCFTMRMLSVWLHSLLISNTKCSAMNIKTGSYIDATFLFIS